MPKFRLAHLGLVMAALGFTAATPVLGLSTFARASGGGVNAELRGLARDAAAFSATNAREAALVYTASAAWMLAAAAAGGLVAAAVPPTS